MGAVMEEDILIQIEQEESEMRWWITVENMSVEEVTCDTISAVMRFGRLNWWRHSQIISGAFRKSRAVCQESFSES